MRVRMLTTVAEPGRVLEAGEEYDLEQDEAKEFCASPEGMPRAEPVAVKKAQKRETRVKSTREER